MEKSNYPEVGVYENKKTKEKFILAGVLTKLGTDSDPLAIVTKVEDPSKANYMPVEDFSEDFELLESFGSTCGNCPEGGCASCNP